MFEPETATDVSLWVVWSTWFPSSDGSFTRTFVKLGLGAARPPLARRDGPSFSWLGASCLSLRAAMLRAICAGEVRYLPDLPLRIFSAADCRSSELDGVAVEPVTPIAAMTAAAAKTRGRFMASLLWLFPPI